MRLSDDIQSRGPVRDASVVLARDSEGSVVILDANTPYIAAGGAAALLAGSGVLLAGAQASRAPLTPCR